MSALPTGTVTFLFSDIEGSTRLASEFNEAYPTLLADQRRLISQAVESLGGRVFGSEGDALFAAFETPTAAVRAAETAQRALAGHRWPADGEVRVRMGIHSGEATVVGNDYVGLTLHQVARVMSAGHGGQVLVSDTTRRLLGDGPANGAALRDLGQHRLKDLSEPVRLYQLTADGLASDFPALRTLSARPNNLPVQLTSFIDRGDLADAQRALDETRLLTLTGPGGTGKTRLALQLAAESLEQFPDGIWFVAMEAVNDPELVPAVIGATVGVEAGSMPPLQALAAHLRDKRVLLVLDNFEQVADAAPAVAQLLRDLPELKVVVTSRVLLRMYGERELPVPPLSLPSGPTGRDGVDAQTAGHSEAVRLFVERARAAQPAFALTDDNAPAVVDIVTRLDGLPLAIELAAARVRILPVEAIRSRLEQRLSLLTGGARDLPARQQTLRGAIDWSYGHLDEPERLLFERFAVFAGGAFLPEAEEVCGPASEVGAEVLDGLSSLVEQSLVRSVLTGSEEPRFTMLATLREYASERLAAGDGDETMRERHAIAYAGLIDRCADVLTKSEGRAWQDRLELDHDNLRAALDWMVARDRTEIAMRMIAGVWRFWQIRGHLHEARRRADEVLAMEGVASQPALVRARGFAAGGGICYWQGDFVGANRYYARALEAARQSGDRRELALALYNYGFAALDHQVDTQDERYRAGRPYFEEALALYEDLGDEKGAADAHWALAITAATSGDVQGAGDHSERALEAYRRLGEPFGVGWAAHMFSLYVLSEDRFDDARALAREALLTFRQSSDLSGMLLAAYDMGLIAEREADGPRAIRIAGAVEALARSTGVGVIGEGFEKLSWRTPVVPNDEEGLRYWNEGQSWTIDQLVDYALGEGDSDGSG